jgi:hypothetical protein
MAILRIRRVFKQYILKPMILYIGSAARTFSIRWAEHVKDLENLRHTNGILQLAYSKYAIDNLEFYIVEVCSSKDCLKRESYQRNNLIPQIYSKAGVRNWESFYNFNFNKEFEEWSLTFEGHQYKRNTLYAKRQKWLKTPVGRDCARQDIKNLRDRLNQSNKNIDGKTREILNYCREYFPDIEIPTKTLVDFINDGIHFKPIWDKPDKIRSAHKKIVESDISKVSLKTKPKSKSVNKNQRNQIQKNENIGCIIIVIIFFILLFLIFN